MHRPCFESDDRRVARFKYSWKATSFSFLLLSRVMPCHERGSCIERVEQRHFVKHKRRGETYKTESSKEKGNRETLLLRVKSAYVSRFTEESRRFSMLPFRWPDIISKKSYKFFGSSSSLGVINKSNSHKYRRG